MGARRATLYMEGKKVDSFDIVRVDDLTIAVAKDLQPSGSRLVRYQRSSPEARTLLRKQGVPFVGADGEVYLHAPPVHVEMPGRGEALQLLASKRPAPFAPKASRISRWLLLNPGSEPSFRELSAAVELSESVVSRTIAALAEDRLVEVEVDRGDARTRRVRVCDSGILLDALERATRRKARSSTWEIGAQEVAVTLRRVRMASKRGNLAYALGGLAGAALLRPVVEPVEAEIWIDPADYGIWLEQLSPIASRRGPGKLTANVIRDPYVLSLARRKQGLLVADPVQLYLDCYRSGERALEAAQAIRAEMDW